MWKKSNNQWINLHDQRQRAERPAPEEIRDTIATLIVAVMEFPRRKDYLEWLNDLHGNVLPCIACGAVQVEIDKPIEEMTDYELYGRTEDHSGCAICRGAGWVSEADIFQPEAVKLWAEQYQELIVRWLDVYWLTDIWQNAKTQAIEIYQQLLEQEFPQPEPITKEQEDFYQRWAQERDDRRRRKSEAWDEYFQKMGMEN